MNAKLNNKVEKMNKKEKIIFIYKWHNGIALAEDLKLLTGDETFEFIPSADVSGYLFKNSRKDFIIIDEDGEIDISDVDLNPIFIRNSQRRIFKTKQMLNAVN